MEKPTGKERARPLFVPEGFADFQCTLCGECCRESARVVISAAKCARLARVLRESGFQFPVRDALMKDGDDPAAPASFAMVGDQCVFLTDEGHCHLCDLGVPDLRGFRCISFPVTPVITPRGVNYSISFACKKTARMLNQKRPLNILALAVNGTPLPSAERPLTAQHQIPTILGRPKLDWSGHRLVEGMLLAIARDWKLNTARRLILMPLTLNHLLEGYAGPGSCELLRERVSHAGRNLPQMIETAGSFRPNREAHYTALTSLFGRRIGLRTKARLRKLVENAMKQVRGRRTKAKGSELGDILAKLYSKHYKPNARRFEHVLGNYVICRLFANRDMLTGGVYKGVYIVAYLVALIRFFATTAAAERGATVNQATLLEAIQVVEKLFVQSRHVFDFLDADEEQERMLDPACAATLVRI